MKKTIRIKMLSGIFFVFLAFSLLQSSSVFALSPAEMVVFEDGKYKGFTQKTKDLIKKSRAALLNRKKIFFSKFRQFESIYHAAHVMRMTKGSMFLYGPPGGAKSLFINCGCLIEKRKIHM